MYAYKSLSEVSTMRRELSRHWRERIGERWGSDWNGESEGVRWRRTVEEPK